MATSRYSFGDLTNQPNQVDLVDVLALMLAPITASMIFEVWTLEINLFGGYDLVDPIWTIGGADISAALLITVFAVGWIMLTNVVNSDTDHTQEEIGIFSAALLAPILFVFVPAFESLVLWHDLVQLMFTLYVAAAAVLISYTG